MKIYVSDKLFNVKNMTGYNNILMNDILQNPKDECKIYFIEDVSKQYYLFDYLIESDSFNNYFWKENLISLHNYNIIITSKELLDKELLNYTEMDEIYYFCEKKNITNNERYNFKNKYLYLYDYDVVDDFDNLFFTKIYTFNSIQANEANVKNIEFVRFNIKNDNVFKLFDNEKKEVIREKLELPKDKLIVLIHLYNNDFYDELDRFILAITELNKEYNIYPIIYLPLDKIINKRITKKDIINFDGKLCYDFHNIKIPIEYDLSKFNDDEQFNINFSINTTYSLTNKEYLTDMFNTYLKDNEYKLITNIDDYELVQHIYTSDIYIPVTAEISYLQLLSQYYKTYTIFTNDSNNSKEYCIYGDIPLLKSNDYIFSCVSKRIKRSMKVNDVKNSIENYIKNKENPFFVYKREFCEYLFG